MKQLKLKKIKNEKGASAVEFALLLPVLVMIVFAIFQFGVAFNNMISLNHAASEGARLAAIGQYDETRIRNSAPSGMIQGIVVSGPGAGPGAKIGQDITVTVIGNVLHLEIPFTSIDRYITQQSTATMRIEFIDVTPTP
jgi:Flp pilus assembly pilin Flp